MKTSADQSISMSQPTCPGDVLPDAHNLAPCAAAFCDSELARYLDLYEVVFRSPPSEKPSHNKTQVSTWHVWFAGIFQSLRQAVQH